MTTSTSYSKYTNIKYDFTTKKKTRQGKNSRRKKNIFNAGAVSGGSKVEFKILNLFNIKTKMSKETKEYFLLRNLIVTPEDYVRIY